MDKRKQTVISLEDKYNAIERLENKECTHENIATELGVHQAMVSKWISKKQIAIIKEAYESNMIGTRK